MRRTLVFFFFLKSEKGVVIIMTLKKLNYITVKSEDFVKLCRPLVPALVQCRVVCRAIVVCWSLFKICGDFCESILIFFLNSHFAFHFGSYSKDSCKQYAHSTMCHVVVKSLKFYWYVRPQMPLTSGQRCRGRSLPREQRSRPAISTTTLTGARSDLQWSLSFFVKDHSSHRGRQ